MGELPSFEETVGLASSTRVHGTLLNNYPPSNSPYRDSPCEKFHVMQTYSDKERSSTYGENQPQAVVAHSGEGDGIYSVYAKIVDGKVAEVRVVFIGDEGEYASVAGDYLTPTKEEIEKKTGEK